MKISEMLEILTEIKDKHGDLPIWISHEWTEPLEQKEYRGIHHKQEYISGIGKPDVFPERVEIS